MMTFVLSSLSWCCPLLLLRSLVLVEIRAHVCCALILLYLVDSQHSSDGFLSPTVIKDELTLATYVAPTIGQ
jgi:hypothetical protein